jgi:hypothetical protein
MSTVRTSAIVAHSTRTERIDPVANSTTRVKTTKKAPTNIPYTSVMSIVAVVSGTTTLACSATVPALGVVVDVDVPDDMSFLIH